MSIGKANRGTVEYQENQNGSVCTAEEPAACATSFVARQPIFDRCQQVYGYELLFRSGIENCYGHRDGNEATQLAVSTSLNTVGLSDLVAGKKAFVNVTRKLLLEEFYLILPKEQTVVELLETVEPDAEVIAACKVLRSAGYLLALDDFVFRPEYWPLVGIADVIKVDFRATEHRERVRLARDFARPGLELLAEKVETHEEYLEARQAGYGLFQGYFFCKPYIVQGREIPMTKRNCLAFLQEVSKPELDFARLEAIVKADASISVKLLRYVNSAAMGVREKIHSIRHALVLLGERPLRKWASLVAMTGLAKDKPSEVLKVSATRGEFCEQISLIIGLSSRRFDLFLLGLLSAADAALDCPFSELLRGIPVPEDVKTTLLGGATPLRTLHQIALACEQGAWPQISSLARQLGINERQVATVYQQAQLWADKVVEL